MIQVEYIENGKMVIIPAQVREALKDFAEHIEINELVQARKDQPAAHTLDDVLAEEGLSGTNRTGTLTEGLKEGIQDGKAQRSH